MIFTPAAFAASSYYWIGANQSINAGHVSGSTKVTSTRSEISVRSFSSKTFCTAVQDGNMDEGSALVGVNGTCHMIMTGLASNRNDWTYYKAPV